MFGEPPYRTLSVYELVEAWNALKAGEKWEDPRTTPVTVGEWKQN